MKINKSLTSSLIKPLICQLDVGQYFRDNIKLFRQTLDRLVR